MLVRFQPDTPFCAPAGGSGGETTNLAHESSILSRGAKKCPFTHLMKRDDCRSSEAGLIPARGATLSVRIKMSPKERYKKNKDAIRDRVKRRRREDIAGAILTDAKRADKKRARAFDLDKEFVSAAIKLPCSYCGETQLRMTLDRIDNDLGHLKSNVVPACERCNYARRDMPAAAWIVVAKAMREARENGLFADWTGGIHHRVPFLSAPKPIRRVLTHGTLASYKKCGPPTCFDCRLAMRNWKRARRNNADVA